MTLTIKDSPEVTGSAKLGPSAQNSENTFAPSPRSNPVCLEVPVIVRSLPGDGNAAGATGPIREEGRSVIVFDNGGVLRISNSLPPGQKIILSNHQGRDVVCRVVGGRSLSVAKGYIEVEFIEPVNDFWHIHQPLEQTIAPPPESLAPPATLAPPAASTPPAASLPQPLPHSLPVERVPDPPAPARAAIPPKESIAHSGGAPTFEDIAGLVLMSPPTGTRDKKIGSAAPHSDLKSKAESTLRQAEASISTSSNPTASSVLELNADNIVTPSGQESFSAPFRREAFSGDFMGKGAQASDPSSSSGPRGRIGLILGGAAVLIAGFGAGYFYLHRGNLLPSTHAVAEVSQPSAPTQTNAISAPATAPIAQPAVEQAPVPTPQPISTAAAEVTGPAPSDSQNARSRANSAEAKHPDPPAAHRKAIPNLKMISPSAPSGKLANLQDGSPIGAAVESPTVTPGGALPGTLSVRTENQPAPPPAPVSAAPSPRADREAKLISSTRPAYPPMAKASNIQGNVVVNAEINEKGIVVFAQAITGPMFLRQAAVESVKQWKYSPAQVDGKPVASQVTATLNFHLN